MLAIDKRQELVRRNISFYRAQSESSEATRALEELLALAVFTFERLARIDDEWHSEGYKGRPYDPDVDAALSTIYQDWFEISQRTLRSLEEAEASGQKLEGAVEFRKCYREAQGMLTPDDKFFTDEALVRARDQAIDEHRRGETIEMREIGD
jgi:hypothetical protein